MGNSDIKTVHIVGGGLAGCEASWQCLNAGLRVVMHEMRPVKSTEAHKTNGLAELVCSNTLKSKLPTSAPGQLKYEMNRYDSLILNSAHSSAVPAGQALGVDREKFSELVTKTLEAQPNFQLVREEITELPTEGELISNDECWIVATGPLSSPAITESLKKLIDQTASRLFFYDAIAPIIDADSIDMESCFFGNRYDETSDDYLNIPLSKEAYETFIDDVLTAQKMPLHSFETTNYFESCLPIEVMAERGRETLRFGPLKPVGFTDPATGNRPWAIIQLRKENEQASMYSLVGFQTKMTWPEQKRVLSKIPALKNAEFFRYGSVHRNSYIESPKTLSPNLSFKANKRIFLAGQITGVEGYSESAAIGLLAGRSAAATLSNTPFKIPPANTMIGALAHYICFGGQGPFQPMNTNLGLLPTIGKTKGQSKQQRRALQCQKAVTAFDEYFNSEIVNKTTTLLPNPKSVDIVQQLD